MYFSGWVNLFKSPPQCVVSLMTSSWRPTVLLPQLPATCAILHILLMRLKYVESTSPQHLVDYLHPINHVLVLQVAIMNDNIPTCSFCAATVKPDVVFFGENLPQKYFLHTKDFPKADLLIIMGTSLKVELQCFCLLNQNKASSVLSKTKMSIFPD